MADFDQQWHDSWVDHRELRTTVTNERSATLKHKSKDRQIAQGDYEQERAK